MGSKAAGKADTISLTDIFLTTVESKSITMTPMPEEVGLFSYIVYTVQNMYSVSTAFIESLRLKALHLKCSSVEKLNHLHKS